MEAVQEAMDPEAEVETPPTSESGGIGVLVIEDEEREDEGGKLFMQFREGNQDAFAQLIALYQPRMFRKILAMVRDFQIAEDLMQEVWLKLAQDISYDDSQPFHPWLSRIVTNHVLDYFRLGKKQMRYKTELISVLEGGAGFTPPSIPDPRIAIEDREEAIAELSILPETYRRTLMLRYLDDLSPDEIAIIEGVSESAIKHRLRVARDAVRNRCVLMTH